MSENKFHGSISGDNQVAYSYNEWMEWRRIEVAPDVWIRAVYAIKDIPEGAVIDETPVVPVYPSDRPLNMNVIRSYAYNWPMYDDGGGLQVKYALSMGMGSVYNNSDDPNIAHRDYPSEFRQKFYTLRDVKRGEELLQNYGWSGGSDLRTNPVDKWLRPIPNRKLEEYGFPPRPNPEPKDNIEGTEAISEEVAVDAPAQDKVDAEIEVPR